MECLNELFLSLNAQNSISVLQSIQPDINVFKEKIKRVSHLNQSDDIEEFAIYNMITIVLDTISFLSAVEKSLIKVIKIRNDLNNSQIMKFFFFRKIPNGTINFRNYFDHKM